MSQQLVYSIPLKDDEEIHVNLKEFKGNLYCDIRVYFYSKDQDIKLPSKKGLTVRVDLLDSLSQGIEQVKQALVTRNALAEIEA
ncbi:transcriptional coactivator p15/PC4 family protein [Candidatus Omnitrophota bacterium]